LADAYLIFTNDKYHRGEEVDWNALFHRQDVTEDVIALLPTMPERIAEMHKVLCSTEAPEIRPSRHCFQPYECEFWHRCTAEKPKDWVFHLPRISASQFEELESLGIVSMRDVPPDFPLKPKQRRGRRSQIRDGIPFTGIVESAAATGTPRESSRLRDFESGNTSL
jgi:hypothetical protein